MCILCDYVLNNIPFVITDYIKTSAKDIKDACYNSNKGIFIKLEPINLDKLCKCSIIISRCNNIKILPTIIFPNEQIIIDIKRFHRRSYKVVSYDIIILDLPNLEQINNIIVNTCPVNIIISGCNELKYITNISTNSMIRIYNCDNIKLLENIYNMEELYISRCNYIINMNNINNINIINIDNTRIGNINNINNINKVDIDNTIIDNINNINNINITDIDKTRIGNINNITNVKFNISMI
jgi:hypothetical protein